MNHLQKMEKHKKYL